MTVDAVGKRDASVGIETCRQKIAMQGLRHASSMNQDDAWKSHVGPNEYRMLADDTPLSVISIDTTEDFPVALDHLGESKGRENEIRFQHVQTEPREMRTVEGGFVESTRDESDDGMVCQDEEHLPTNIGNVTGDLSSSSWGTELGCTNGVKLDVALNDRPMSSGLGMAYDATQSCFSRKPGYSEDMKKKLPSELGQFSATAHLTSAYGQPRLHYDPNQRIVVHQQCPKSNDNITDGQRHATTSSEVVGDPIPPKSADESISHRVAGLPPSSKGISSPSGHFDSLSTQGPQSTGCVQGTSPADADGAQKYQRNVNAAAESFSVCVDNGNASGRKKRRNKKMRVAKASGSPPSEGVAVPKTSQVPMMQRKLQANAIPTSCADAETPEKGLQNVDLVADCSHVKKPYKGRKKRHFWRRRKDKLKSDRAKTYEITPDQPIEEEMENGEEAEMRTETSGNFDDDCIGNREGLGSQPLRQYLHPAQSPTWRERADESGSSRHCEMVTLAKVEYKALVWGEPPTTEPLQAGERSLQRPIVAHTWNERARKNKLEYMNSVADCKKCNGCIAMSSPRPWGECTSSRLRRSY